MSYQPISESKSLSLTTNKVLNRFPKLLRRFYEPLVFLSVLNPVRGIRFSNNGYRLDDSLDELRRSFINGLATICDSHKGGDTVTAAALQSTPQQTIIWVAANKNITQTTIDYLHGILDRLVHVTADSKQSTLEEITDMVITFCQPKLQYYRNQLDAELPRCLKKIQFLERVRF
jgi:hypothetical protein